LGIGLALFIEIFELFSLVFKNEVFRFFPFELRVEILGEISFVLVDREHFFERYFDKRLAWGESELHFDVYAVLETERS